MIKKNRILSIMLILGLSASMSPAKMPPGLTQIDCRLIFPGANSCEKIRTTASGVLWTEAWRNGAWEPPEEFLGYVFLKSLQHEGKTINVLVGMTNRGMISSIRVKGIDGVDEKFLAQFRGKTSLDNFDLARTPEDLLFIPAKIKARRGNFSLSESIAQGVKEIVKSGGQVLK